MAKPIDKLLKFLDSQNVAEVLGDSKDGVAKEDRLRQIGEDVYTGYEIDASTRERWLRANKEAMSIINTLESDNDTTRDFPFKNACRVVYPLLGPAVIQMAARMTTHVVKNGRVLECAVLGKDSPEIDPVTQQPTGMGIKAAKSKRVTDYMNYKILIKSKTWLTEEHKLNSIVASWGTGFKRVKYNYITDCAESELLDPENVIINHNVSSLNRAPRITILQCMYANDIVCKQRAGEYLDIDLSLFDTSNVENDDHESDPRDPNKTYEFLEQFCWMDLDEDGIMEPYFVEVHSSSKIVEAIYPAFDIDDIILDDNGDILHINARHGIIDRHCIDDPSGKFYSMGLNHLLLHSSKSITAILRQLIDAGTLSNVSATSGFVTKAFKTKERNIRIKMGEFSVVDIPTTTRMSDHIASLPFKEPSSVLLGLLQFMVENAEKTAFLTDVLTGDTQGQNVPATTMLAMVEQGTRAFKPVIEKQQISLKNEFLERFRLEAENLDSQEYFVFQDEEMEVIQDDFDEESLDIVPVSDPTMSSEAHKYARLQAMLQFAATPYYSSVDPTQAASTFFTDLQFSNVSELVPPPKQSPDPKLLEVQVKAEADARQQQLDEMRIQIEQFKAETARLELQIAQQTAQVELGLKASDGQIKAVSKVIDAHKDHVQTVLQDRQLDIEDRKLEVERERVHTMAQRSRDPKSNSGNSSKD